MLLLPSGALAADIIELVPGTGVLLSQGSDGGGSGGTGTVASSNTTIFTPSAFVDYKRFGGEPTVVVDRYPFAGAAATKFCPTGQTSCPARDIVYQSAPNGFVFPHYSQFYKSDEQPSGQSFRKSQQFPVYGLEAIAAGGGGGDSHQAIGQLTHDVYFVDLTLAPGITINTSEDLGETWRSDPFGEGLSFLDDRQWVEADEAVNRVYISTINLLNLVTPTLAAFLNTTGAPTGGFNASPCNPGTFVVGSNLADPAANDGVASPCPDPADPYLWVAGPIVADNEGTATRAASHNVYVPFIRRISEPLGTGLFGITAWQIYIAKSTNNGATWTRHRVADLPANVNPSNIFPQMTIDRGGNLYYTWSQSQNTSTTTSQNKHDEGGAGDVAGEQDIYYTWSTRGGLAGTWAAPINLTKEANDSAVFPWLVAGDPGQVDIVYYKANNGINSNVAFVDANGNACEQGDPGCNPNPAVWNVFFGQSQNALNTGPNFKSVQVSAQPNHIGVLCTGGLGCDQDRDLLDFFTVDVDHLGAAVIAYSDDHQSRNSDTRDKNTRQVAGNSVFKNVSLSSLLQAWPIRDHAVTDRTGDVVNTSSQPKGSCPGMDLSKMTVDRTNGLITVTLTLNGAPTRANAIACGDVVSTGGLWGAEFWAPSSTLGGADQSNTFYIAYRDDANGTGVEGGVMDNVNVLVTSLEFRKVVDGTLGGTCLPSGGPPATGSCTISMTVSSAALGIPSGGALNNTTGLSVYSFGEDERVPLTRVILGNSELADATVALYVSGTGTP
jgi:hypothetical protein